MCDNEFHAEDGDEVGTGKCFPTSCNGELHNMEFHDTHSQQEWFLLCVYAINLVPKMSILFLCFPASSP